MTKELLHMHKVCKIKCNPGALINEDLGGLLKGGMREGSN